MAGFLSNLTKYGGKTVKQRTDAAVKDAIGKVRAKPKAKPKPKRSGGMGSSDIMSILNSLSAEKKAKRKNK